MRLVIALFVLAVLATTCFAFAVWDGGILHRDKTMRAIHYGGGYDLSAQRRKTTD